MRSTNSIGARVLLTSAMVDLPGQKPILGPISLGIEPGERVAIIGASGSGKSTLLKLIAGLVRPTAGTVEVTSRTGLPVRVGLAPQSLALLPWRNVLDNVLLSEEIGSEQNNGPKASTQTARELLAAFGLEDTEALMPWQLSGGMQSRVALARALVGSPQLLLLDEPLGSLDEATGEGILVDLMHKLEARNSTVLLISHNLRQAAFLADRLIVVSRRPGRVISEIVAPDTSHDAGSWFSDELNSVVATLRAALKDVAA